MYTISKLEITAKGNLCLPLKKFIEAENFHSVSEHYSSCFCLIFITILLLLLAKPGGEQLIVDQENFKGYDTNDDGKLDRNEIRAWTLPHRRVLADEEAEHLIQETDMNNDERLSFDEILDRHDLWVGSAATDYGQSLHHDPSEL